MTNDGFELLGPGLLRGHLIFSKNSMLDIAYVI